MENLFQDFNDGFFYLTLHSLLHRKNSGGYSSQKQWDHAWGSETANQCELASVTHTEHLRLPK